MWSTDVDRVKKEKKRKKIFFALRKCKETSDRIYYWYLNTLLMWAFLQNYFFKNRFSKLIRLFILLILKHSLHCVLPFSLLNYYSKKKKIYYVYRILLCKSVFIFCFLLRLIHINDLLQTCVFPLLYFYTCFVFFH